MDYKEREKAAFAAPTERVQVTVVMVNVYTMQVCAVEDATDEEILETCNRENPAGTALGWTNVVRHDEDHPQCEPVACAQVKGRVHFQVRC